MARLFAYLASTPTRLVQFACVMGFILIVAMSLGAHFIIGEVTRANEHSATTINLAGKQRMLSQRTAYLLSQANTTGNASTLHQLRLALDEFQKNHIALVNPIGESSAARKHPDAVEKILYKGFQPLDAKIVFHIGKLNEFYERIKSGEQISASELAPTLVSAEQRLLKPLNLVVDAFEEEANKNISYLLHIQQVSIICILIAVLLECALVFIPLAMRVKSYRTSLEKTEHLDALTNLENRHSFITKADQTLEHCRLHSRKVSLLLCNLDRFTFINDAYGHKVGDQVIQHFSNLVRGMLRKDDIFARVAGEEFAILLPEASLTAAVRIAERINAAIRDNPLPLEGNILVNFTASIGVTDVYGSARNQTTDDLLYRANGALLDAKRAGRDCHSVRDASSDFGKTKPRTGNCEEAA